MPNEIKVGLVLSGGGAKGAYQVGVVKALRELGATIDMVSGASIGALNGAILASAPSFTTGVDRLEKLWLTLAQDSPISIKSSSYLQLLAAAGLQLNGLASLGLLIDGAHSWAKAIGTELPSIFDKLDSGILCDKPLQSLMDKYLDTKALAHGLPLYISVFESLGSTIDLLRTIVAEMGILDTPGSEFLHIQSLPEKIQKEALLASAAIPLLFAPRNINGSRYSDGGQGGWQKAQGNTPIKPLLEAGCNMVIVTHLSDGSLWSRHDFPEATILEIRPQSSISRDTGIFGGPKDLLGFDQHKIPSWIEQGYQDTHHCVGNVMKTSKAWNDLKISEKALDEIVVNKVHFDSTLANILSKLK